MKWRKRLNNGGGAVVPSLFFSHHKSTFNHNGAPVHTIVIAALRVGFSTLVPQIDFKLQMKRVSILSSCCHVFPNYRSVGKKKKNRTQSKKRTP